MIVLSSIVAAALVLAQGCAVWAFLRFVKTFGAYTASQEKMAAALLYTHESNLILHKQNLLVHQASLRVLEELKALKLQHGKVA